MPMWGSSSKILTAALALALMSGASAYAQVGQEPFSQFEPSGPQPSLQEPVPAPPPVAAPPVAPPPPVQPQAKPAPAAKASAQADILSPAGNWQIAAGEIEVAQGQAVPYCSISNEYAQGGRLEFYGTGGQLAAIKVNLPGREFKGDQTFTAGIRIPGGYNPQVKASVVGTSTLLLNVKGDQALATSLHNGQLLYITLEGIEYPFSLSGINHFGDRMRNCKDSLGDMVQNFLFKAGPQQRAELEKAGIESQTLEILAAPPKSDPAIVVEQPNEPLVNPLASAPAPGSAAPLPLAASEIPTPPPPGMPFPPGPIDPPQMVAPQAQLPPPPLPAVMPQTAETLPPMPPRGQVLASISDDSAPPNLLEQPPEPKPAAPEAFDELFPAPSAQISVDPPQMAAIPSAPAPQPAPVVGTVVNGVYSPPPGVTPSQTPSQIPSMTITEGLPPRMEAPPPSNLVPADQALSSTPAPQWRALKGSSLREVLALWALDNKVELIWNADEQYRVKQTLSLNTSFEGAVETLLKQFEPDFPSPGVRRPVGQLYVDPAEGKRVLVIKSQAG